ncbi:NADPH:quinone oxidoreductase family protein [Planococcus sp. N028]|uniref:NADPH:quinone oxidoreductase family protein n=1 Tax=Planococcus shixiaomingii TaxID=3058393 RepID=A0ABT8N5P3_9BACL|nr:MULTISPECIES: NADPH:quinone oxidoreductase family protein [unclassified Planococcus (in: firmicutes)]MDN7243205.1 NADPH:quinone oxidoreductase family protein [Planococcus sp. N028]WKA55148.1 NADPH:quinone oxidoreductase family protein [Planococcus sp. N022]
MKVIQFEEYGGPEVLKFIDAKKPVPAENEVIIEVKAIGVNYADTARREGQYVVPTELPYVPGSEVAGVIVEIGSGVKKFQIGMRVVALIEAKGYAEYAAVDERILTPVPDGVDFDQAVALPLQGLSAYHILKTMGRLEEGESVLIHAAAGGVGTIAVQLAKIWGAGKIIATASSEEKLAYAASLGATDLVNYTEEGWEQKVKDITGGKGADLALEMVGGEVFNKTVKCLAPFGRLVIFGAASGKQATFNPGQLMRKNQSVIGFFLPQIMRKPELFQRSFEELLGYMHSGQLELTIGGTYPLAEAAEVHRLLQGRKTIGKLVLKP